MFLYQNYRPLHRRKRGRHVHMCSVRKQALQNRQEVRIWLGMAVLFRRGQQLQQRDPSGGQEPWHGEKTTWILCGPGQVYSTFYVNRSEQRLFVDSVMHIWVTCSMMVPRTLVWGTASMEPASSSLQSTLPRREMERRKQCKTRQRVKELVNLQILNQTCENAFFFMSINIFAMQQHKDWWHNTNNYCDSMGKNIIVRFWVGFFSSVSLCILIPAL